MKLTGVNLLINKITIVDNAVRMVIWVPHWSGKEAKVTPYIYTCQFIQMVRNKMRKLLVLLLVQILLTVSDYLIIAPFLPPKPRQLILHFTISEISLKNSLSFIQILFLY